MSETMLPERRSVGRVRRAWWTVSRPGRIARFNRWRRTPATVTKGYLAFKDTIVLGFVIVIVFAGVTTVRTLRREDCQDANRQRANAADVAHSDVDSDRKIWEAIDKLIEDGIPEPTRTVIFNELLARKVKIESTYAAQPCPA